MELQYIWIENYKNLLNQQFYFGGEFIYTTERTPAGTFQITRSANPTYIRHFFSNDNGTGFVNISAIVGENGVGKTNALDLIRKVIADYFTAWDTGQRIIRPSFIAVFADEKGANVIYTNGTKESLTANFKYKFIDEQLLKITSIYYSPSYDFKEASNDDIDVSSDFLLYDDYEIHHHANEDIAQADIHKYANASRQLQYVLSGRINTNLQKIITLPKTTDIVVKQTIFRNGNQQYHNSPESFRPFFEILSKIFQREIQQLGNDHYRFKKLRQTGEVFDIEKRQFITSTLHYLLYSLIGNIEKSNQFLQRGQVNIEEKDLEGLSYEKALLTFIRAQDLYPKAQLEKLIDEIKNIEPFIQSIDSPPQNLLIAAVPISAVGNLQSANRDLEQIMYTISAYSQPYGFLEFNWTGLSSGQKAYLDLYSRIFYANTKIRLRMENITDFTRIEKFPENILLLLDEAELGFHPQWQKEYIKNLIDVVPLLFYPEHPAIQVIFTTHSPISLSDIPANNITFLHKKESDTNAEQQSKLPRHSFAANIHDLMQDAFYLRNGYTGDFARMKIQDAIDWCRNKELTAGAEAISTLINTIDEPIIKVKLAEMYAAKMGRDVEIARLEVQRSYIEKRLNELNKK